MKRYSAVIVNYNCAGMLRECLDSVLSQTEKPLDIVIVDSASTDGSVELLGSEYGGLKAVMLKENKGFTAAANTGIKASAGEFVLIMNSDVILDRYFAEKLLGGADKYGGMAGVFSGLLLKKHDETLVDSAGQFLSLYLKPKERGYLSKDSGVYVEDKVFSACGAAGLYSRKMLESIAIDGEYFDEDLFMYYEDMDLGLRANIKGWASYFIPSARALHARGGSVCGEKRLLSGRYAFPSKPLFLRRALVRNRILVLIKSCPLPLFLICLPFVIIYDILFCAYLLFFDIKALYGIIEALKLAPKIYVKRKKVMEGGVNVSLSQFKWLR